MGDVIIIVLGGTFLFLFIILSVLDGLKLAIPKADFGEFDA